MIKFKPILVVIGAALLTLLLIVSPLVIAFGKTGKNTQVLDKDYSLLSKKQILDRLQDDFTVPVYLYLTYQNRDFELSTSKVNLNIDRNEVANSLLFRRLNQGLGNYISAFFRPKNFTLDVSYDAEALDKYVSDVAAQIDKPFIPTELFLEGSVKSRPGAIGTKTKTEELKNLIITSLSYYTTDSKIQIPVESVGSLPADSEVNSAIANASKLIGKSLLMSAPDTTVVIDDKTLVSWVGFTTNCREDKINSYVEGLKTSLKKDPVEPVFKFENGKVLDFKPSTNGYTLDGDKLNSLLCSKVTSAVASSEKALSDTFPVNVIEAVTQNSEVNDLGIKELLGSGKSTFKHSSEIRNFNVEKGASIVNRILVAPGETFSFLKHLGDVTLEAGFKKAYVIKKGKTELDVGGGICQVSTTLFRAMLNSGLDITERRNHAYRVRYYEEDSPPGYDATVFIPSPDLKFINDTGHHLLIQNTYDGKNKTLVYEIYGTNDGRKTEITNYRQWDATPPPPDIYIDDPTLPPGKVIQDEQRIPGLKTSFDWKVTRDGQVIHQKTFVSNFVPWAAVFRRGIDPAAAPSPQP